MGELVSTVLLLVLIGFIADINTGAIVGSLFSARSGFRPGFAFLGGATVSKDRPGPSSARYRLRAPRHGSSGSFEASIPTTYILISLAWACHRPGSACCEILGKGVTTLGPACSGGNPEAAGTISVKDQRSLTGVGYQHHLAPGSGIFTCGRGSRSIGSSWRRLASRSCTFVGLSRPLLVADRRSSLRS